MDTWQYQRLRHIKECIAKGESYCRCEECKVANVLLGTPEDLLLERLERLALENPRHDYHAPSATHIMFVPWIQPWMAKGFGDFPDEAFEDLKRSVITLLEKATAEDLALWDRLSQTPTPSSRV